MGIKIRIGQTPNSPWWELGRMTDEEIKEFNNRYMHEEEMSEPDDNNNIYIARFDMVVKPYWDGVRYIDKQTWNTAIEVAANELKSSYPDHAAINAYCACVRSLKK